MALENPQSCAVPELKKMTPRPDTIFYFAYGSNLYSKRLRIDKPSAVAICWGLLKGYKIEFTWRSYRWNGAAANIRRDERACLYGVIWELSLEDLPALDRQEGVAKGEYEQCEVLVEASDGSSVQCLTYCLTPQARRSSIEELGHNRNPSPAYKNVMVNGARENCLPKDYIHFLEDIVDNGYDGEIDSKLDIGLKSQMAE